MFKKVGLSRIVLSLCLILFLSLVLVKNTTIAKPMLPSYFIKLTLENSPQIGGIAVLKLEVVATFNRSEVDIGCFLPEGLELIQDNESSIIFSEPIVSPEKGERIVFYSGPMANGEKKEFIFKVGVPDGRKYVISGGAVGKGDYLEIDLGDPEPPEWNLTGKKRTGIKDEKPHISTSIKQLKKGELTVLEIPEDTLPPLRTEIRIRTKDKPYVEMPYNPEEIPLRYLVYTEEAVEDVEVIVELPQGLELVNDKKYEVTLGQREGETVTIVKLFQGSMDYRESKAFYLKVRSDKKERFKVRAQTKVLTYDGEELIAEDYQVIELGRILL